MHEWMEKQKQRLCHKIYSQKIEPLILKTNNLQESTCKYVKETNVAASNCKRKCKKFGEKKHGNTRTSNIRQMRMARRSYRSSAGILGLQEPTVIHENQRPCSIRWHEHARNSNRSQMIVSKKVFAVLFCCYWVSEYYKRTIACA